MTHARKNIWEDDLMKKGFALMLCLMLAVSALAGCGEKSADKDAFGVTVTNSSGYIFNELYVSASAADAWGEDHLGSTSVLKNNGSFDISLTKYEYSNYDIKVVDEEGDVYLFNYVSLTDGTTVGISFEDGLIAVVTDKDGAQSTVEGTLNSGGGGLEDTPTEFYFTIYNESAYDIYAIYMAPAYTDGQGVDVLPSVLSAGDFQDVEGSVAGTDYEGIMEWTLYVVDVDDDASASYDVFDPWLLSYVNVTWDSGAGGYTCEFVY